MSMPISGRRYSPFSRTGVMLASPTMRLAVPGAGAPSGRAVAGAAGFTAGVSPAGWNMEARKANTGISMWLDLRIGFADESLPDSLHPMDRIYMTTLGAWWPDIPQISCELRASK